MTPLRIQTSYQLRPTTIENISSPFPDPPEIDFQTSGTLNYTIGDTISLKCLAGAKPIPVLTWMINDKRTDGLEFIDLNINITKTKTLESDQVMSTFEWPRISGYPFAKISCEAINDAGFAVDSATAIFNPRSKNMQKNFS